MSNENNEYQKIYHWEKDSGWRIFLSKEYDWLDQKYQSNSPIKELLLVTRLQKTHIDNFSFPRFFG